MGKITESHENYLEAILELQKENPVVRSVDIARKVGVSRPSVNKAIGILRKEGLVEHEQYGRVYFTEKGKQRTLAMRKRHMLLKKFLTDVLKVDEETADKEACKIEHDISESTIEKLTQYLENVLNTNIAADEK